MIYDPAAAAAFYDEYGTPTICRYVREGDRVLDIGCSPERFTLELVGLGARVVAADVLDLRSSRTMRSTRQSVTAFSAAEVRQLLELHGTIVAANATGMFARDTADPEPLAELELSLGAEPGGLDVGRHILNVLEVA